MDPNLKKKLEKFERQWQKLPVVFRKPFVLVVGSAFVIAGAAMIILPGPGWACMILGFAIMSLEFHWAARAKDGIINFIKATGRFFKKLFGRFKR